MNSYQDSNSLDNPRVVHALKALKGNGRLQKRRPWPKLREESEIDAVVLALYAHNSQQWISTLRVSDLITGYNPLGVEVPLNFFVDEQALSDKRIFTISNENLRSAIIRLYERGHLEVRPDQKGRTKLYHITKEGLEFAQSAEQEGLIESLRERQLSHTPKSTPAAQKRPAPSRKQARAQSTQETDNLQIIQLLILHALELCDQYTPLRGKPLLKPVLNKNLHGKILEELLICADLDPTKQFSSLTPQFKAAYFGTAINGNRYYCAEQDARTAINSLREDHAIEPVQGDPKYYKITESGRNLLEQLKETHVVQVTPAMVAAR